MKLDFSGKGKLFVDVDIKDHSFRNGLYDVRLDEVSR